MLHTQQHARHAERDADIGDLRRQLEEAERSAHGATEISEAVIGRLTEALEVMTKERNEASTALDAISLEEEAVVAKAVERLQNSVSQVRSQ